MGRNSIQYMMMGTEVEVLFTLTDPDGNIADTDFPIVQVLAPDPVNAVQTYTIYTTPAVIREELGTYSVRFVVDVEGQWIVNCSGTSAGVIADDETTFFVKKRRVPAS